MENNYESILLGAGDPLRGQPAGLHLLYGRRIFFESERTAFLPARAGRDAGNPRGHR